MSERKITVLVHYDPDKMTLQEAIEQYDAKNMNPHIVASVDKLKELHPNSWEEELEFLRGAVPFDGRRGYDEDGNFWDYSQFPYMYTSWKVDSKCKCMWDWNGVPKDTLLCNDVGGIDDDNVVGVVVNGDEFWTMGSTLLDRVELYKNFKPNDMLVATMWTLASWEYKGNAQA